MKVNEDNKTVAAMDVLVPKVLSPLPYIFQKLSYVIFEFLELLYNLAFNVLFRWVNLLVEAKEKRTMRCFSKGMANL